jgi:hypothetical protein
MKQRMIAGVPKTHYCEGCEGPLTEEGMCPVCNTDDLDFPDVTISEPTWIASGPFGGKTTLYKRLQKYFPPHLLAEGDEVRKSLPGWESNLWSAWRPEHPGHRKWKELDKLYHERILGILGSGGIVLVHDLPIGRVKDVSRLRTIFICPPYEDIFVRMNEYVGHCNLPQNQSAWAQEKKKTALMATIRQMPHITWGSRLGAAAHYWSKDWVVKLRSGEADPAFHGVVIARSGDEAFDMIKGYYNIREQIA